MGPTYKLSFTQFVNLRTNYERTYQKTLYERYHIVRNCNYVFAFFNRSEVVGAVLGKNKCDITIAGKLTTGQCIYGKDTIRVVSSNGNAYGRTRQARPSRRSIRSRRR